MYKIIRHKKDITTVKQGIVIHGCNAQGKMNSGVAKAIRNKWPSVYEDYLYFISRRPDIKSRMGEITQTRVENGLIIINGITQEYYGYDSRLYVSYTAIGEVFDKVMKRYPDYDLYFPLIGCGLGGGKWSVVEETILLKAKQNSFKGSLNLCVLEN